MKIYGMYSLSHISHRQKHIQRHGASNLRLVHTGMCLFALYTASALSSVLSLYDKIFRRYPPVKAHLKNR
ncbi:MAG: hypothetical protein Q4G33_10365 [bacterium]|nr:hypothetical protein [bacterium]